MLQMERSRTVAQISNSLIDFWCSHFNRNSHLKWQAQNTSITTRWILSLCFPLFRFLPRLHLLPFVPNTVTSINRHVCYLYIMQHKNQYSVLPTITFLWENLTCMYTLNYIHCLHIEGNLLDRKSFLFHVLEKTKCKSVVI